MAEELGEAGSAEAAVVLQPVPGSSGEGDVAPVRSIRASSHRSTAWTPGRKLPKSHFKQKVSQSSVKER